MSHFAARIAPLRLAVWVLAALAIPLLGCGTNPSGASSGSAARPYYEIDNSKTSEVEITIYTTDEKPLTVWVPRDPAPPSSPGGVVSRTITTGSVTSGKAEVQYSRQPFKIISVTYDSQQIPPRK